MAMTRGLAALAVLLCLGISCGGLSSSAPDDGQAAAEAFLDAIRKGQVEPAWTGTTAEFKSLIGLDTLREYVLETPADFVESRMIESGRGPMARYTFHAVAPTKTKGKAGKAAKDAKSAPVDVTIQVTTCRTDGAWKVERLALE